MRIDMEIYTWNALIIFGVIAVIVGVIAVLSNLGLLNTSPAS